MEHDQVIDPSDPWGTAQSFASWARSFKGIDRIWVYRGTFYLWREGAFAQADDSDVIALLWDYLVSCEEVVFEKGKATGKRPARVNQRVVVGVFDALRFSHQLPIGVYPPCIIEDRYENNDCRQLSNTLIFSNGFLELESDQFKELDPDLFFISSLNYPYLHDADLPEGFLRFLAEITDEDQETQNLILDYWAYAMTENTHLQKALLILGPKRSGKSLLGRLLSRVVGPDNVVSPPLSSIGRQFGLEPLIDKKLVHFTDARLGRNEGHGSIVEKLLSISGEDSITVERKHKKAQTLQLGCKIIITSNEVPAFEDGGGALASRFLVARLRRSFLGQEDPHLFKKLEPEVPLIATLLLKRRHSLLERGYFNQPTSGIDALNDMKVTTSPIIRFVEDRCRITPGGIVPVQSVYEVYQIWCSDLGLIPLSDIAFGKELKALFPDITAKQKTNEAGNRQRFYFGIELIKD